jgi:hypothetical protein
MSALCRDIERKSRGRGAAELGQRRKFTRNLREDVNAERPTPNIQRPMLKAGQRNVICDL